MRIYIKVSFLRGACELTRWESESNESMYERCSVGTCASGMKCGVVEEEYTGHIESMMNEKLKKSL